MPYPQEYQVANIKFHEFLDDVKKQADFVSTHMTYSMVQGVLQVFRRRISLKEAIRFSNLLPAGLRAFFVADWNPDEEQKKFTSREILLAEVQELRKDHNFSFLCNDAIKAVAYALRKHVDNEKLDKLLSSFPAGAKEYWEV